MNRVFYFYRYNRISGKESSTLSNSIWHMQSLGMQMSKNCTRRKSNIKIIQKLQDRGSLDIYDESWTFLPVTPYTDLWGSSHNARNLG